MGTLDVQRIINTYTHVPLDVQRIINTYTHHKLVMRDADWLMAPQFFVVPVDADEERLPDVYGTGDTPTAAWRDFERQYAVYRKKPDMSVGFYRMNDGALPTTLVYGSSAYNDDAVNIANAPWHQLCTRLRDYGFDMSLRYNADEWYLGELNDDDAKLFSIALRAYIEYLQSRSFPALATVRGGSGSVTMIDFAPALNPDGNLAQRIPALTKIAEWAAMGAFYWG